MKSVPIQILLAEDNPGDVYLVRLALEQSGLNFALVEVTDGEQAVRYLNAVGEDDAALAPAIVLLDLNLPRVDGKNVLEHLRTIPKCLDTRAIVLTSSEYPADRADVDRLGADCYFHKPQDLEAFLKLGDLLVSMCSEGKSETPQRLPRK
ncbi:MAG: response regulator [Bryobacteraceae bacterium]